MLLDPVLVLHIDCINKMVKEYASRRIFIFQVPFASVEVASGRQ